VICTVRGALASPINTVPRFKVAGEIASIGGDNPVPLKAIAAEATPGLDVPTVSVAVVAPTATGVKTVWKVHTLPAARLAPQVVADIAKLAAPAPAMEKLGCSSGPPPEFERVTVLTALATPSGSLPKLRVVPERVIAGGFSPAPLRLTDCARSASEMTSVPVSAAATLGVKVTVMPQEEFAASWLPQLFTAVKSAVPVELEIEVPMPVSG